MCSDEPIFLGSRILIFQLREICASYDRAFDVKVDNLRNQVNSYEERLRRSRLRWNQLFQSQFELKKGGPAEQLNDALENSSSEDKPKPSDSVVREKKFSNQMTSSLSNRYYLGFSVGALMAQPPSSPFLTTRYQLNLIPELQVVWKLVVNSINGVSH